MDRYISEQIEFVCKFGPGGDFVSFWPDKPLESTHPAAITAATGGHLHIRSPWLPSASARGEQPLLFPDNCRNKLRASHKPRHIFRAYNRADKKRPAPNPAGQDLLFEAGFKNAKTA